MLEEATDELFSGKGAVLDSIGGRFFVAESDLARFELHQAVIADSDAEDVRSEILESLLPGADRLAVNHPVFFPDAPSDLSKQPGVFQFIAELGAEDHGERFFGDQKVFACGAPAPVVGQAAAGDDEMNVGMIAELASPGLQHADHAEAAADESGIEREFQ